VGLTGTELICNPIALNGEVKSTQAATFEDGGDNLCRCGDDVQTCQVLSTGLSPPAPIDDVVQPPATP